MIDYIISQLSVLSAILNTIGWGTYLYSQISGVTKSNPVGWLMSLIIAISSYIGISLITNDWSTGLMYAIGIVPAFIAFTLSLKNKFIPTKQEGILFLFGMVCLIFSKINPSVSLGFISLYLFGTYFIFAKSLIQNKTKESILPWIIWSLAAICQIFAIFNSVRSEVLINTIILPCANLLCWGTIAFLSIIKKDTNAF